MQRSRINLQALRDRAYPRPDRHLKSDEQFAQDANFDVSRRDMLGIVSAATALPVLSKAGLTRFGSVEMFESSNRISFSLRGAERWSIDTSRFAGKPKLTTERQGKNLTIRLEGARFPGTDLAADLEATITPTLTGHRLLLRMDGAFESSVSLEPWLLGMTPATGKRNLDTALGASRLKPLVEIRGIARTSFSPDWTLRMAPGAFSRFVRTQGKLARYNGVEGKVATDFVTIALMDAREPGVLNRRIARRTLITLERGENEWAFDPVVTTDKDWTFRSQGSPFNQLHFEAAESRTGKQYIGLLADAADNENPAGSISIAPTPRLKTFGSDPFQLNLARPRYAVAFGDDGRHAGLVSRYGTGSWINTDKYSAVLGEINEESLFEISGKDGCLESVTCEPGLLRVSLPPLTGSSIVRPLAPEKPTALKIKVGGRTPTRKKTPDFLHVRSGKKTPKLQLNEFPIEVTRPEDLCIIRFNATGMTLSGGMLQSGSGGILVAHFQPQHITERAFFEASPNTPTSAPPGAPADKDEGIGSDPLEPPPVDARIAGGSRLAFKVPAGETIPFTLEGMLAACRDYDLNVSPLAQPRPIQRKYGLASQIATDFNFGQPNVGDGVGAEKVLIQANKQFIAESPLQRGRTRAAMKYSSGTDLTADLPKAAGAPGLIRMRRDLSIAKNSISPAAVWDQYYIDDNGITDIVFPTVAPTPPSEWQTALEIPWRLIQSPTTKAAWLHAAEPVTSAQTGQTELWHTRMATRQWDGGISEKPNRHRVLRAIWYADKDKDYTHSPFIPEARKKTAGVGTDVTHMLLPFRMALDAFDRHNIVHLSSNYTIPNYKPEPIDVRNLMLSSLGGWINVRGSWKPPTGLSVEEWLHRGTLGRDHYVKVVYQGKLFPFGNDAALVKITERKFQKVPPQANVGARFNNRTVAYLRQRMFIVVREPDVLAGSSGIKTGDGRSLNRMMPFKAVRILTENTPMLDKPENSDVADAGQSVFWPQVAGKDFLFDMQIEDIEGRLHDITMPLAFVEKTEYDTGDSPRFESLKGEFNSAAPAYVARNTIDLSGNLVSYAESAEPGDTELETKTILLGTLGTNDDLGYLYDASEEILRGPNAPNPPRRKRPRRAADSFVPFLKKAAVIIPAAKQLTGTDQAEVIFPDGFLKEGFKSRDGDGQPTSGESFLKLVAKEAMDFSTKGDKTGGLSTPSLNISGLSRFKGPIGFDDPEDFDPTTPFNAEEFFAGASPKLFGVVDLWDVLQAIAGTDSAPAFLTDAANFIEDFMKVLNKVMGMTEEIKNAVDALPTMDDVDPALAAQKANIESALEGAGNAMKGVLDDIVGYGEDFFEAIDNTVSAIAGLTQEEVESGTLLTDALNDIRAVLETLHTEITGLIKQMTAFRSGNANTINAAFNELFATEGLPPLPDIVGNIQPVHPSIIDFGIDLLEKVDRPIVDVDTFLESIEKYVKIADMVLQQKIKIEWRPKIKSWPASNPVFLAENRGQEGSFVLSAELNGKSKQLGGKEDHAAMLINCQLDRIGADLIGSAQSFLAVFFTKMAVGIETGKKPQVDVVFDGLEFRGPLKWVERLRSVIPMDGFSDPPYVELEPSGIRAGFTLEIPTIAVGVFTMQNMSFGAEVTIPFVGDPLSMSFFFNTRENPCIVTVYGIGGGFFFQLRIGMDGFMMMEAAIELGASIAFDIGVASGGVKIMAGIYFRMELIEGVTQIELTGYLVIAGHVSVLGLITISIEVRLELSYVSSGGSGKVKGKAMLKLSIEILFFSWSKTVEIERKFAGDNNDPTFVDQMDVLYLEPVRDTTVHAWDEYCTAFAEA